MSEHQRSETWGQPTPEERAKYHQQPKPKVTPEQRAAAIAQLKEALRLKPEELPRLAFGLALLVVGIVIITAVVSVYF